MVRFSIFCMLLNPLSGVVKIGLKADTMVRQFINAARFLNLSHSILVSSITSSRAAM